MAVDLKRMHYFCTIAEQGQISRAARVLHMAQPPLSQRLKELEEELGTPLFHRKGRGLELSEAGALFYRRARDILRAVESSREEVIRLASQAVPAFRLGLSPTCRAPWLERFDGLQALLPARQIGVVAGDSSYLEQLLGSGQLEAAFMLPPLQPEHFLVQPLLASPTVAVAPAGLLPEGRTSLGLADLAGHPLMLLRRSVGVGTYERLQHHFQEQGLTPRIALYSSDVGLLRDLLAQGFPGLAVVPGSEAAALGPGFRVFTLEVDLPDYQLSLVYPRQGYDGALIDGLLRLWGAAPAAAG